MRDKRGLGNFGDERNRRGSFYEVFRKPDHNDPHRPYVSIGGMLVTTVIAFVLVLGLIYILEESGFRIHF